LRRFLYHNISLQIQNGLKRFLKVLTFLIADKKITLVKQDLIPVLKQVAQTK